MANLTRPFGGVAGYAADPVETLLRAIEDCRQAWERDPAYADATFKLLQVERELDTICASPGHRAALRALPPNDSGQEPTERSEPPSDST